MMKYEAVTTIPRKMTKVQNPQGLRENQNVAREGGTVAGNARRDIEQRGSQQDDPQIFAESGGSPLLISGGILL